MESRSRFWCYGSPAARCEGESVEASYDGASFWHLMRFKALSLWRKFARLVYLSPINYLRNIEESFMKKCRWERCCGVRTLSHWMWKVVWTRGLTSSSLLLACKLPALGNDNVYVSPVSFWQCKWRAVYWFIPCCFFPAFLLGGNERTSQPTRHLFPSSLPTVLSTPSEQDMPSCNKSDRRPSWRHDVLAETALGPTWWRVKTAIETISRG